MVDFFNQRKNMIKRYTRAGYIRSHNIAEAIMRVPRENFMDQRNQEYAYHDQPFPIPGDGRQTISAPYMYPTTYEPLDIKEGQRFLEIGAGSGYGAAIARELVGSKGIVVAIEINKITYEFAKQNLLRAGYDDVILILGDGTLGYPTYAPYDAVSITAASPEIPRPIIEQLATSGKIVAPVGPPYYSGQDLILFEKSENGKFSEKTLMRVVYVPLLGEYGWRDRGSR